RQGRETRAAQLTADRAAAALDALTALVGAADAHLRTLHVRQELEIAQEDLAAADAAGRETGTALLLALTRVRLLTPALAPTALKAYRAVELVKYIVEPTNLVAVKLRAQYAIDDLVIEAAEHLA
ncbi:hypothetical protein, partial [Actinomadura sp. RB99]|uniref:hypothetical protein n=1 Tax=Actinomadura sp. RB99 TaxID=2691577 RepID=UPI001683724D